MNPACLIKRLIIALSLLINLLFPIASTASDSTTVIASALAEITPGELFPGADRIEPLDGEPAAARVFQNDQEIGLVFLNSALVNSVGYSGKPIHILVGVDTSGVIQIVNLLIY